MREDPYIGSLYQCYGSNGMKHKGNQSRRERRSRWGDINRKQEEEKLKEKKVLKRREEEKVGV